MSVAGLAVCWSLSPLPPSASGASGQCWGLVCGLCLLSETQLFFLLSCPSLPAGRPALYHGDGKARAAGLLQGSGQRLYRGGGRGPGPPALHSPLPPAQGLLPAGIRLMPHTVLTFLFLEQLRKHFGIAVPS